MHTNILRYEVINKYHVIIVQLQNNFNEQKKYYTQNRHYGVKQEKKLKDQIEESTMGELSYDS